MKKKIYLDEGFIPLYSSKRFDKLTLKSRRKTYHCRNFLPNPRDSLKNPYLSRIFHHNFQETIIPRDNDIFPSPIDK
jgi:hypothetical protein